MSILFNLHFLSKHKYHWLSDEMRKNYIFPLENLPLVAIKKVIDLMTIDERIKLAVSSEKMEKYIKMVKVKNMTYHINAKDEGTCIEYLIRGSEVPRDITTIFCGRRRFKTRGAVTVSRKEVDSWCSPKSGAVQNMVNVYNRLINLFPCQNLQVSLTLRDMHKTNVIDFLSIPIIQNVTRLVVNGHKSKKELSIEDLNFVMDNFGRPNIDLYIIVMKMPEEYRNENAFKCRSLDCVDARWVQLSDILSIRNSWDWIFSRSNFNEIHILQLINYWIECDRDMFEYLKIITKTNARANPGDLIEDQAVLIRSKLRMPSFFFLAKNPEDRDRPIGSISWIGRSFLMHSSSRKTRPKTFKVLNLLQKKKDLEEDLRKVRDGKKREIEKQIQELRDQLTLLGVYYQDGRPVLD